MASHYKTSITELLVSSVALLLQSDHYKFLKLISGQLSKIPLQVNNGNDGGHCISHTKQLCD